MVMIVPLFGTMYLSFFREVDNVQRFSGLLNFRTLFFDERWSAGFWNALGNNVWFFLIHLLVQTPIGVFLAAILATPRLRFKEAYRAAIFMPYILSPVIVGIVWKMILSPLWGVAPSIMATVGLKSLFGPYLGNEGSALTTLALISVWQFAGFPMLMVYTALLSIPDEVTEAADCDGVTGWSQFWRIQLPLVLPTIGIISILTFIGTFNAFDLVYVTQGPQAGPSYSTDLLGTYLYRAFFGMQLQQGDPNMGATIASVMFIIIMAIVCLYLYFIQRRLRRYQF